MMFRQPYSWRGFRQTQGIRPKMKRVLSQFSPHDFTAFKWGTASDFLHYFTVVILLLVFLAAELNPFYLKVSVTSFSTPAICNLLIFFFIESVVDGARSPDHYSPTDLRIPMWFACSTGVVPICQRSEVGSIFELIGALTKNFQFLFLCSSIKACSQDGTACLASSCHDCYGNTGHYEME